MTAATLDRTIVQTGTEPSLVTNLAAPAAVLSGVTKRYGKVTALDNLSLTLRTGKVVALLGPNGAGKSTAVRLLLGLASPTHGTARVFGADPRTAAGRQRTGAMLQVASLPKTLTVGEHVDLFRSYYPAPLPAAEIVRIAMLEEIEKKQFQHLSGGQKQRLLFGLAIAGDPEMVFLDEPTVGMDIEARRGLWEQIRALSRRGKTVLLTTHYLEEADALADRIVVLNKGVIVSEGTPAEIKNIGAARRIRCTTRLSAALIWSFASVVDVQEHGQTMTIMATQTEDVVRRLLAEDETLSSLEIESPRLEDAFLALTRNA